ncbi:MAG TPA: carbon storage regulator CsrA [Solirubrobacteraceae bacterium]|nr:carbon storage regulator CsrA [Solirubrobacteraceae bacterium]
MLRIKRRAGERVIVGDDVVIEVLEVRGGTVRLGIEAPRSVPVYREEIWLEIKRENEASAAAGDLPELPVVAIPASGPSADGGRAGGLAPDPGGPVRDRGGLGGAVSGDGSA